MKSNTYALGTLVMWYEIEMVDEYIDALLGGLDQVNDTSTVTYHFCWNEQQFLERLVPDITMESLRARFMNTVEKLEERGATVIIDIKTDHDDFYNISQYRRDLNYNYCEYNDFVIWGETDSLFPRETFDVIDTVSKCATARGIHKYVMNFAYRKNWDSSWDVLTHPLYRDVTYFDVPEWFLTHPASSKSYMDLSTMYDINDSAESYKLHILSEPKFDGSCLVISSDLIKSGVNIPHAVMHCAEDTSFGEIAKLIMGSRYRQFSVENILRVHNRRHPKKRMYIDGEDNPMGFNGDQKGDWWSILQSTSKNNLRKLVTQEKFTTFVELIDKIKSSNT